MITDKYTKSPLTAILTQGVSTTYSDRTEAARRIAIDRPRLVKGDVST